MNRDTVPLEEAMSAIIDYRGKTPPKSDRGTWLVTAKVVKNGFIAEEPKEYIPSEDYDTWMRRGLPEIGDVLVTTEAPMGQVAAIRSTAEIALAQRLILLRADSTVLDQDFLLYSMQTPAVQNQLRARATGTTVLGIKQSELRKVLLPAPALRIQQSVGRALRAFDDLIENNRRRIGILEEMARLLYREWFVHFRYPGHEDVKLVDSELGPIPEGWEVGGLTELCSLVMGQSPKSEFYNEDGEGLPFHQGVTDFGFRYPTHRKWTTVDKRVAEAGDVLFSVRAPVGRINVAPDRMVVGRGLSAIRAHDGRQESMLLQLKDQFAVEDSIGGGTIFNAVTKADMERIKLLRPTGPLADQFQQAVVPMASLGQNLTQQNRVLREARDLLLPRLVSGELDASDLDLDGLLA